MSDVKQSVQDQFGPVAANYRTSTVHAAGVDLQLIAAAVQGYAQALVLDVGCGAGHVSRVVAPFSAEVVACDLTASMLGQVADLMAEHGITNVRTQQGDVEQLPFDDASFDLVLSRYSAHHWPNPNQAIGECLRVLRPGGKLLISDIVAPEEAAHDSFLQAVELLRDLSHVRDHRISEWLALFAAAGVSAQVAKPGMCRWSFRAGLSAWPRRSIAWLSCIRCLPHARRSAGRLRSPARRLVHDQGCIVCRHAIGAAYMRLLRCSWRRRSRAALFRRNRPQPVRAVPEPLAERRAGIRRRNRYHYLRPLAGRVRNRNHRQLHRDRRQTRRSPRSQSCRIHNLNAALLQCVPTRQIGPYTVLRGCRPKPMA